MRKKRETIYPEVLIFKMDSDLANKLRQRASSEERTKAWLVRKALENFLHQENNKPATVSNLTERNGCGLVLSN